MERCSLGGASPRHAHPTRLREPLDAPPRGPHRAGRRHARPLRLDREAAGRGDRAARRRARVAGRTAPASHRRAVLGVPAGRVGGRPERRAEDLARGELAEETGLRAAVMEHLGQMFFAYGITDQSFDVWRATGLEPGSQALEATEADLQVGRFAVAEFEAMIASGGVRDAATVAAWHLATRVA